MRLLPRSCRSSFRTLSTMFLSVVAVGAVSVGPASAQSGVIAFQDGCDGRLYGMRGDSSDRMPLPLPPLPEPPSEYRYSMIGFTAHTSSTPCRAPCSTFVNTEIFLIKANGSGIASLITHTNGTSVEAFPKWGW